MKNKHLIRYCNVLLGIGPGFGTYGMGSPMVPPPKASRAREGREEDLGRGGGTIENSRGQQKIRISFDIVPCYCALALALVCTASVPHRYPHLRHPVLGPPAEGREEDVGRGGDNKK